MRELNLEVFVDWVSEHFDDARYASQANVHILANRMLEYQVEPTKVALNRATAELIREGILKRTDGGNAASDAALIQKAKDDELRLIETGPSTSADFQYFSALSRDQIFHQIHIVKDKAFGARYRAACRQWGFEFPNAPTAQGDSTLSLTASEYRALPMAETKKRYKQEPAFRAAVDQLIAVGQV